MKTYNGYDYIAYVQKHDLMYHRNGYVRLPETHPYYEKVNKPLSWDAPGGHKHIHLDYDAIDINVHGDLTFAEMITQADIDRKRWAQGFIPGLWIGWDYAHAGDCFWDHDNPKTKELGLGKHDEDFMNKHWTLEEIEADCKDVIDQLIAYENKNHSVR